MTLPENLHNLDWQKGQGLIPVIVQDALCGDVLMLGYMNEEALERTLQSQKVTFYSRSRQTLWQKGETSGHTLDLVSINTDCDRDTLLVQARPNGPTCHNGTRTCFAKAPMAALPWLGKLGRVIDGRADADPKTSYTASLLNGPIERAAQKVGEEGVEVALAALSNDPDKLPEEAADLLYHLMVVLRAKGLGLDEVVKVLKDRHQSAD
ncbi:MAG: bifunctional phosphoribosyl-AMP cyclohydrolase/phosphoribosyl-ATP diphosphatase [Robiginitomaculum sp.]|nr:MAG: bifunctional phosphoribosyl-AMP cyclohydrolase/phosphoribosyl-ATP diphosphatase [Robiginitomaculum sp.]